NPCAHQAGYQQSAHYFLLCRGARPLSRRLGPHPQALSLAPSCSLGLKAVTTRAFAASPLGIALIDSPLSQRFRLQNAWPKVMNHAVSPSFACPCTLKPTPTRI